jgi:hypothetical protein
MKTTYRTLVTLLLWGACLATLHARGESARSLTPETPARKAATRSRGRLPSGGPGPPDSRTANCSPAPCVLPPTQASEGGALVNTSPIVGNPSNPKQLLMGSNDWNCPEEGGLGFHVSLDGGATWGRTCMTAIQTKDYLYDPGGEPLVGYSRDGVAYIAGSYSDSESGLTGLEAIEKSYDGIHWSQPTVALFVPYTFASEPGLAVDNSLTSPYLGSVYVSAVMIGPPNLQSQNQVTVAHSRDQAKTWNRAAAESIQTYPANEGFTSLAVAKDGTVYVAWQHCAGAGPSAGCTDGTGYMVFSKSTDGGVTWSRPALITAVTIAPGACHCYAGDLPNTNDNIAVYNYPAISVDNSDGPYAGTLYVTGYSWTGTYMRVQVIRSTDGGNTWSNPVPVAPAQYTHDQFFPWISVSPTGLVGVSWLDRRNDPANIDYQAFAAISADGGKSFGENVQLTTAFSNPNVNGYPFNEWMGDYTGNTWDGPDYFVAAWMDSSNGIDMQEVVGGIRLK